MPPDFAAAIRPIDWDRLDEIKYADEAGVIAKLLAAEPLKADHPLAQLPNVTLTSHAAFRTLEASMTLLRRAIDIVKTLV